MSENVRETGREQRSESRERRRSLAAEPFENVDRQARSQDESQSSGSAQDAALGAAKRAAGAAAAAAVAGGLAGAAKALLDRRRAAAGTDDGEQAGSREPEATTNDGADESSGVESPTARASDRASDDDAETADVEGSAETEDDAETPEVEGSAETEDDDGDLEASGKAGADERDAEEDPHPSVDEDDEDETPSASAPNDEQSSERSRSAREQGTGDGDSTGDHEPRRGVPADDLASVVARARASLEELVGMEPESVSSVKRKNGSWSIALEVVEVRRIPDSTDVLSTYQLVLDQNGGIVEIDRTRRYRRSQVEEA
jgi:hypothetical protein